MDDDWESDMKALKANPNCIVIRFSALSPSLIAEVIQRCSTSDAWHKFEVRNVETYERDFILKTIIDFVHPSDLLPVSFLKKKRAKKAFFMARNCLDAVLKMMANKLIIPNPVDESAPLRVIILANYVYSSLIQVDLSDNIISILKKRVNNTKTLDLCKFHAEPDLQEFCLLSQPKLLRYIMQFVAELRPLPQTIELRDNYIKTLEPIRALTPRKLSALDLRNNEVSNVETYERDFILKTIIDFVHPSDLLPVSFKKTKRASFVARNCLDAILKIMSNRLNIPNPLDKNKPLKVIIIANNKRSDFIQVYLADNIRSILRKRLSNNNLSLDLCKFHAEPDLQEFCLLSQPKMLSFIMQFVAELTPVPPRIELRDNYIKVLEPLRALAPYKIRALDLRNNELATLEDLEPLRDFIGLQVLKLDGNPLCDLYSAQEYIAKIKDLCPDIKVIDNVTVFYPNGVMTPKKNFLCDYSGGDLVNQFIHYYFTVYDYRNRNRIIDLYDKEAIFSVSCRIIPGHNSAQSAQLNHYMIINRDLYSAKNSFMPKDRFLFKGSENILKIISKLPRTFHDPLQFQCDLVYYTEKQAALVVHGIFREQDRHLGFSRSFVLRCDNENTYSIINDQLHVFNALDSQVKHSHVYPVNPELTYNPLPFYSIQYTQLQQAVHDITDLNYEYSRRFLEICNFDLKAVLIYFKELHKNDRIPPEAFIEPKKGPLREPDDKTKPLLPPVIEARTRLLQGVVTPGATWRTLNNDRIAAASCKRKPASKILKLLTKERDDSIVNTPAASQITCGMQPNAIIQASNEQVLPSYTITDDDVDQPGTWLTRNVNSAIDTTPTPSKITFDMPPEATLQTSNKQMVPSYTITDDDIDQPGTWLTRNENNAIDDMPTPSKITFDIPPEETSQASNGQVTPSYIITDSNVGQPGTWLIRNEHPPSKITFDLPPEETIQAYDIQMAPSYTITDDNVSQPGTCFRNEGGATTFAPSKITFDLPPQEVVQAYDVLMAPCYTIINDNVGQAGMPQVFWPKSAPPQQEVRPGPSASATLRSVSELPTATRPGQQLPKSQLYQTKLEKGLQNAETWKLLRQLRPPTASSSSRRPRRKLPTSQGISYRVISPPVLPPKPAPLQQKGTASTVPSGPPASATSKSVCEIPPSTSPERQLLIDQIYQTRLEKGLQSEETRKLLRQLRPRTASSSRRFRMKLTTSQGISFWVSILPDENQPFPPKGAPPQQKDATTTVPSDPPASATPKSVSEIPPPTSPERQLLIDQTYQTKLEKDPQNKEVFPCKSAPPQKKNAATTVLSNPPASATPKGVSEVPPPMSPERQLLIDQVYQIKVNKGPWNEETGKLLQQLRPPMASTTSRRFRIRLTTSQGITFRVCIPSDEDQLFPPKPTPPQQKDAATTVPSDPPTCTTPKGVSEIPSSTSPGQQLLIDQTRLEKDPPNEEVFPPKSVPPQQRDAATIVPSDPPSSAPPKGVSEAPPPTSPEHQLLIDQIYQIRLEKGSQNEETRKLLRQLRPRTSSSSSCRFRIKLTTSQGISFRITLPPDQDQLFPPKPAPPQQDDVATTVPPGLPASVTPKSISEIPLSTSPEQQLLLDQTRLERDPQDEEVFPPKSAPPQQKDTATTVSSDPPASATLKSVSEKPSPTSLEQQLLIDLTRLERDPQNEEVFSPKSAPPQQKDAATTVPADPPASATPKSVSEIPSSTSPEQQLLINLTRLERDPQNEEVFPPKSAPPQQKDAATTVPSDPPASATPKSVSEKPSPTSLKQQLVIYLTRLEISPHNEEVFPPKSAPPQQKHTATTVSSDPPASAFPKSVSEKPSATSPEQQLLIDLTRLEKIPQNEEVFPPKSAPPQQRDATTTASSDPPASATPKSASEIPRSTSPEQHLLIDQTRLEKGLQNDQVFPPKSAPPEQKDAATPVPSGPPVSVSPKSVSEVPSPTSPERQLLIDQVYQIKLNKGPWNEETRKLLRQLRPAIVSAASRRFRIKLTTSQGINFRINIPPDEDQKSGKKRPAEEPPLEAPSPPSKVLRVDCQEVIAATACLPVPATEVTKSSKACPVPTLSPKGECSTKANDIPDDRQDMIDLLHQLRETKQWNETSREIMRKLRYPKVPPNKWSRQKFTTSQGIVFRINIPPIERLDA